MTCQMCYVAFFSFVGVYNMSMLALFIYVAKLINNIPEVTDNSLNEYKIYYDFLDDSYRYYIIAECMYSFISIIFSIILVYLLVKSYELEYNNIYRGYRIISDDSKVEKTEDITFPLVGGIAYTNTNTNTNSNFKCFHWRANKSFSKIYIVFIIYSVFSIGEAVATSIYCSLNLQNNINFRDYLLDLSKIALTQFDIKFGIAIFKLIGSFIAIPTILICNHS